MGVATAEEVRAHFRAQAEACERLGSPFTAGLCRALAHVLDTSTQTGRKALGWSGDPQSDALALRLCGGLHALVLSRADLVLAAAFPPRSASQHLLAGILPATFRKHDARLASSLDHPPQTNEVARSAMLLPGLLTLAREWRLPLALHEVAASAGLNLLLDRFQYRFGNACWGEAEAKVALAPELRGVPVPLGGELRIAARRASDLAPVSVLVPEGAQRLRSFVWADQTERLARLDAAVSLARAENLRVRRMDAAEAVARMIAERRTGEGAVLMHSVAWQYMSADTRRAMVGALAQAGESATPERPLAWLRMEPRGNEPHAALGLTVWPGGATRHLADCDFHGRWIAWK